MSMTTAVASVCRVHCMVSVNAWRVMPCDPALLFEFRSAGSQGITRQALTDTMQWTLQTEATAVVIDITPVGGGQAKHLLLAPSATPHRLFVSNLPAENQSHSRTL